MHIDEELQFFSEQGYLHIPQILTGAYLHHIQNEFDKVWEQEKRSNYPHRLLKYSTFLDLLEYPPIINRHIAVFGPQIQLLRYNMLIQGPNTRANDYSWHRDLNFPGYPAIAINTIIYLDPMIEERGPLRVIPKSHKNVAAPTREASKEPMPGEVAIYANPGDVVFINASIWHTGGKNKTAGFRRAIFLYFGYWWLKRYDSEISLPASALEGASEQRLRLLGVKMPGEDLHLYENNV
jgi:hypothetical protein